MASQDFLVRNGLVVTENALIMGDLTVQGNTTTINTSTLDVEDLNVTIAKGAANATAADGAGITVDGASATLLYESTDDSWNFNKDLALSTGVIKTANGTANVFDTTTTTVNAFGAATAIDIGASSGTLNINNTNTTLVNLSASGNVGVTGTHTVVGLTNANGGIAVDTNKFTVDGTSGAVDTQSTLTVAGLTTLNGGITADGGVFTVADTTGNIATSGDLEVNGGDFTTTASTFNLLNQTPTTVNAFKNATTIDLGATTGTFTLNNPTIVGSQASQDVFNTTATTVNAFGAASTLAIGNATSATLTLRPGTVVGSNTTQNLYDTVATTVNAFGAATSIDIGATSGTLTINNPTIVGTNTTQNVFDTTATTVNAFGAATSIDIGATGGTLTINNPTVVGSQTTQNVFDTVATTINFGRAATAIDIGASTGTTTINNNLQVDLNAIVTGDFAVNGGDLATTATTFNLLDTTATTINFGGEATTVDIGAATGTTTIKNDLAVVGATAFSGDLAVNGGDLTTTATTFNLLDATATTVNAFGAATTIDIGATSGTLTINNPTVVGSQTTQNLYDTVATTVNAFGAATSIDLGATTGTLTINNPTIVGSQTTQNVFNTTATTVNAFGAATDLQFAATSGTTTINNALTVDLAATITGDLAVNGGDLTTTSTTLNLFDANATTVSAFGAATAIDFGASTGTTTINNDLIVTGDLTINGTTTTVNAANLAVEDKNISLNVGGTAASANGGGITLDGANASLTYATGTDSWSFNKNLENVTVNSASTFNGNTTIGDASSDTLTVNATSTFNGNVQFNGTVNAAVIGNSSTATKWATARDLSLTGDATGTLTSVDGSANVSAALTLATSGVTAATYGSATQVAQIAVDAKGRVTSASNVTVVAGSADKWVTARNLALTGDVTGTLSSVDGSANVSAATTLANSGVTAATYGSATTVPQIAVDAKGRVTSASSVTIVAGTADKWTTARNLSLTGDVTATLSSVDGSAAVSAAATLANSGVAAATYGSATQVAQIAVDAKGRITSASNVAITADTLQAVTTQGATTSVAIDITNATASSSSSTGALKVSGGLGVGGAIYSGTSITSSGDITAYSDERLKTNVQPIKNAKEIILQLEGVTYVVKDTGQESLGFIAQKFQKHLPSLVKVHADSYLSLDYSKTTAVLVEAFKEQDAEIKELKEQMAQLQQAVNSLLSK